MHILKWGVNYITTIILRKFTAHNNLKLKVNKCEVYSTVALICLSVIASHCGFKKS